MSPLGSPWAVFHRSTAAMRAVTSRSLTVGNGALPPRSGRGTGMDRCTEPYPGRSGDPVRAAIRVTTPGSRTQILDSATGIPAVRAVPAGPGGSCWAGGPG